MVKKIIEMIKFLFTRKTKLQRDVKSLLDEFSEGKE